MELLVAAVVLAWVVLLAGAWMLYLLFAQMGRVLLRLEGLERHLGDLDGLTLRGRIRSATSSRASPPPIPSPVEATEFPIEPVATSPSSATGPLGEFSNDPAPNDLTPSHRDHSPRILASASAPSLLYVSPVLPAPSGNGLAMRAAAVLRLLAEHHTVTLLVAPLYHSPISTLTPELASLCCAVIQPTDLHTAQRALNENRFDRVHLFRLATLEALGALHQPRLSASELHLDLDDLESETHRRLADLYRANGEHAAGAREQREAARSRRLEDEVLRRAQRVYVCSEQDRAKLADRGTAEIVVLPNTIEVPAPLPPVDPDAPFTLVFVGTLGYYPNEDGIRWFCSQVLPHLERQAGRQVRVRIVGTAATSRVQALHHPPRIDVVGAVSDLAVEYRVAHAAIVPLRAGGGTRIKVLEAFSFLRPVVSTPVGIEGIEVERDREVLVADSPRELAAQCLRILTEPGLSERLTTSAFALVQESYSHDALRTRLAATLRQDLADR